jgi:PAS domain S-box-containing protein
MNLDTATLRWLKDSANYGILTTDAELKVCGWNRWLELQSGQSADRMLGRHLLEAYPELVGRRLDGLYHQALAGQVVMLSHRFHRYLLPLPVQRAAAGFTQMQQSARIAPLLEDDRVIGTITLIEDVTERVIREEELARQIAVQDALHEIDRAILSLDLPECLNRVVTKTAALVGAPMTAVVLREGTELRVAACTLANSYVAEAALTVSGSIAAWAAESRQALLLADVGVGRHLPAGAALHPLLPDSRSVVAAPLLVEDQVIGALVVESPRPDAFGETEQTLVIALATQAAVGIQNARLHTSLRESEDRYRDLIEHSHDLICTHDLEGRILTVNLVAAKELGYRTDELVGRNIRDILAPELRDQFPAYLETIRCHGAARGLMRVSTRTGERRIWEYDNTLRTEGVAIPIVRGMAHDVTERLRAEKRSRAFSQLGYRLSAATNPTQAARIVVDVADKLLGWDACYFDLYSEATGTTTPILNMDIIAGQRVEVPSAYPGASLTPTTRRVLTEGGQLILRDEASFAAADLLPFGDTSRPSASLLFVSVRSRERVVGILSIQSYTPHAYDRESLAVLQSLADHAGGALERIQAEATEREQRLLAETLRDTVIALTSTLDFDAVLDTILDQVAKIVPYDSIDIMLIQEGVARIVRYRDRPELGFQTDPAAVALPIATTADLQEQIATGEPLLIPDVTAFPGWVWVPGREWIRSHIGAPIRVRGQVIGFLDLDSAQPGFYNAQHLAAVRTFAAQAAVALENARLLAEAKRRAAELEALYETAIATTGTLETDALLAEMSRQICRLIAVDSLYVVLYDADAQECRLAFAISDDEVVRDRMVGMRLPLAGGGLIAWVVRTGQTLHIGDVLSDPLPTPPIQVGPKGKRTWLGVPLIAHDRLIGVITVQSNRPHAFSAEDRRLLEALAAPIGVAMENARLYTEVRRHAAGLEQRVAERTAELTQREAALRAANEKLKELDRLKSQFISNVSHELRTPLTNIKTSLWLFERGKPEKRAYYLATIGRESELLHRLIEDLLQLSRLDLGKAQPAFEMVNLDHLVGTLVEDRTALFAERGLTLRAELAADLPPVRADPKMLIQVLTNLMTNAMNYTPAGGTVTVSTRLQIADDRWQMADGGVKTARPAVSGIADSKLQTDTPQSTLPNPQWVTFSVSDTGPGIPAEDLRHLFQRFYRGEAARKSGSPGTGLGLSICQELVERHGGHITLESEVGKGSVFTVLLPLRQETESSPPQSF